MPELRITIRYADDGFPNEEQLAWRFAVEKFVNAGLGEVLEAGAGFGGMDVFADVADGAAAIEAVRAELARLGILEKADLELLDAA